MDLQGSIQWIAFDPATTEKGAVLPPECSIPYLAGMVLSRRRSLLLLGALALAACDDGAPPQPVASQQPAPVDPAVIRIAGTGAGIPLVTRLAQAWNTARPSPRVLVEPSVGTTGGIRAAHDGAVDLGLSARALLPRESSLGLLQLPVARDAVVFAAHPSVKVRDLPCSTLVDMMEGRTTRFPDGTPALLLLRDRDDTAHSALELMFPQLRPARDHAYRSRRLRVLRHDDAMGEALSATPGAVGPFSLGAISADRLALEVLSIDGLAPTPETISDGRWKAVRDISFVLRPDRLPHVVAFLGFVSSSDGQRLMRDAGYLPLPP